MFYHVVPRAGVSTQLPICCGTGYDFRLLLGWIQTVRYSIPQMKQKTVPRHHLDVGNFRIKTFVRFSTDIAGGASAVGPSAEQQTRMTKFSKRLVWYPAVLIASWTFATINRIQNAIDPDHPDPGLFLLHVSEVGNCREARSQMAWVLDEDELLINSVLRLSAKE